MISTFWTLFAFIRGGCAGMLLMALMRIAADPASQSVEYRQVRRDTF